MAARSLWKGALKLGSTRLPVKLYSAVQDRDIHFHVLEKRTLKRIQQHMVDPETNTEVPKEQIRKGYQLEKGVFVPLDAEELARFQPKPSRDIEILEFVAPEKISDEWYERPYWLGPDGETAQYFAFVAALGAQEKEGVARWVMRNKEYRGAIRPQDGYLALVTLRYSDEVLSPRDLKVPETRALSKGELKMAEQLIETLRDEFRPEDFKDEYRDRVLAFIEAKAKGHKPRLRAARPKRSAASLMDQLSKSLKVAQKEHEEKAA